jgi:hypothetical protein
MKSQEIKKKEKATKVFISLRENYAANFGFVFRSSAIFWAVNTKDLKTTICLTNYWLYKNDIQVSIVLNLRDMKGNLVSRDLVCFEKGMVKNFVPPDNFTGTVEIEAFSNKNLRIPYAAAMAVYEAKDSVSMVHSYARSYSQQEVEENRMIDIGRESCWTLRDTHDLVSFCVMHNGSYAVEEQIAILSVRTYNGLELSTEIKLGRLEPFQTIVLEPIDYFPNLSDLLGAQPGNARLSFHLGAGFTRMLCGVRNKQWTQVQVTHSNFDYSLHDTDLIDSGDTNAYFYLPKLTLPQIQSEIVIYPDRLPKKYTLKDPEETVILEIGQIFQKKYMDALEKRLVIFSEDAILPTRIVNGLRLNSSPEVIPAECSLGVAHHEIPPKHFSWLLVSNKFNSIFISLYFNYVSYHYKLRILYEQPVGLYYLQLPLEQFVFRYQFCG